MRTRAAADGAMSARTSRAPVAKDRLRHVLAAGLAHAQTAAPVSVSGCYRDPRSCDNPFHKKQAKEFQENAKESSASGRHETAREEPHLRPQSPTTPPRQPQPPSQPPATPPPKSPPAPNALELRNLWDEVLYSFRDHNNWAKEYTALFLQITLWWGSTRDFSKDINYEDVYRVLNVLKRTTSENEKNTLELIEKCIAALNNSTGLQIKDEQVDAPSGNIVHSGGEGEFLLNVARFLKHVVYLTTCVRSDTNNFKCVEQLLWFYAGYNGTCSLSEFINQSLKVKGKTEQSITLSNCNDILRKLTNTN